MLPVSETLRNAAAFRPLLALCDAAFLTSIELAEHWRMSVQHMHNMRRLKAGPPYVKLGGVGAIRYRLSEILAWEIAGQGGMITHERIALALGACPGLSPAEATRIAEHLRVTLSE